VTTPSGAEESPLRTFAFLVALFAAALTLRPQLSGLGPLLPRIQSEFGVPHGVVGLLGTIPAICMGVFSPVAPLVANRLGAQRAVTWCIAVLAGFGMLRAFAPDMLTMIATTFAIGIAVGVGGALLPVAVKLRLPNRPALATSAYAAGIQLGAAGAAFATIPTAQYYDTWRAALVLMSAVTALLGLAWWSLRVRSPEPRVRRALPRPPWRERTPWLVAFCFVMLSGSYHAMAAWLPSFLIEAGWAERAAGNALAVTSIAGLTSTLAMPVIINRVGSRRGYLIAAGAVLTVATAGLILLPAAGWVWIPLIGFAQGVGFFVVMILPLDMAVRPDAVGAVAGLVLGAGYLLSAPVPSLLGALRDASGAFILPFWVLAGMSVALVVLAAPLTPARLRASVDASVD
jgi:MFS transporter, CP family, cyanate transporter